MTAFVNGGITDTAKKSNLDSKYGPYESVHAAYTALTSPTDYVVVGLTVGIQTNDGIVEYWFQNGTNESDLVRKVPTVDVPVQSVNSKTGEVVLDNTDVGAAAAVHTHTVSDITNFPSLASVATSGSYTDLSNTPSLATVATTGSYSDLSGKPTIPEAQVQTDWNASTGISSIANKPSLATVATSGSYTDLSNKPEIPAAQIQANWAQTDDSKKDFIKNKPNIPSAQVQSNWTENDQTAKSFILNKPSLATVATTGAYSDLTGTPTIPAAQVQSDWNASSGMGEILNKPTLATVATTGSYNDLTNRPNIPAAQVQADWTESDTSSMAYIAHKPTIPAAQVQSDWNQTNTSAPDYIKNKPAIAGNVQADWTENDSTDPSYIQHKPTLATVATSGSYNDLSNQPTIPAAQIQSDWNQTDTTALDYIKNKPNIVGQAQSDWTENDSSSPAYILHKPTLATVATSGSYNDLSNKPTIPAAQVQTDWNASSGMGVLLNKPTIPTAVSDLSDASDYMTVAGAEAEGSILLYADEENGIGETIHGELSIYGALNTQQNMIGWNAEVDGDLVTTYDPNTETIEVVKPCQFDSTVTLNYVEPEEEPEEEPVESLNLKSGAKAAIVTPPETNFSTILGDGEVQLNFTWTNTADSYDVTPISFCLNPDNSFLPYINLENVTVELFDDSGNMRFNASPYGVLISDQIDFNHDEDDGNNILNTHITTLLTDAQLELVMDWGDGTDSYSSSPIFINMDNTSGDVTMTFDCATSGISYNDLDDKPTIPSISGCEVTSNKVTSLTAQSTDTQYPSAKCVYDIVGNIESALTTILGV